MNYPRWFGTALIALLLLSSCLLREDSSQRGREDVPALQAPDTAGLRNPELREKANPSRKKSADTIRPSVARSQFED